MTAAEPAVTELSVWRSVRATVSSMSDDFLRFVAGNLLWLLCAAAALLLGRFFLPAHLLAVLLVPASFGLARMAANSVRGRPARLYQFRAGAWHRGAAGFGLGCAQLLAVTLGALNIVLGVQAASLLLALSAIFSGYVLLAVGATIATMWPLLLDPVRDQVSTRRLCRLALTVIAARPGRIIVLVLIEALLVAFGLQTFIAAALLPSFGILLASWVVLTAADQIEANGAAGPES